MSPQEIESAYEANTGEVIARHFAGGHAMEVPAVLVAGHGPFCWGTSAAEAAHNAVILEYVAEMAYYSVTLAEAPKELDPAHLDKHFLRKHGVSAYYGQK
jgi:L-ribulose-5-phosphate 4-epimerase